MPEKMVQIGLKIPDSLYSELKSVATDQGTTATKLLISIL